MKCRRLIKRFLCYGCVHLSTFLPVLIFIVIDIFNSEFDGSAHNLPFNVYVPFNMESIWGWLFVWFLQINESFTYNIQMITTTTQFVCFCYYIVTMCNHLNLLIDSIRLDSQDIRARENIENQILWLDARAKLQRAIEMHADIYE